MYARRRTSGTILLTCALIALVGCSSTKNGSDKKPQDPPSSSPTPGPGPTPPLDPPTITTRTEAWNDVALTEFDAILPDGRAWAPLASEGGKSILVVVPPQKGTPRQLVLIDVASRQSRTIAEFAGMAQPIGAAINGDWAVWSEAADDPDYLKSINNWQIRVYDRKTQTVRDVSQATRDAAGKPIQGPYVMPKLSGNIIAWSPAVEPPGERGPGIIARTYDLGTNKSSDVIPRAANAVPVKGFVVWLGQDGTNPNSAVFWNKNGTAEQLTSGIPVISFTTDGEAVAFAHQADVKRDKERWVVAIREKGAVRTIFSSTAADALQFPTMNARLLTWTAYNAVNVYDRKLNKIVTLESADASYSSVFVDETAVYWTTPIPKTDAERAQAKKNGIIPAKMHIASPGA